MSNFHYIYNYSTNKISTFSIDLNIFDYPIKGFYTSKKLRNINMYINDTYISTGTSINSEYTNLYKLEFFINSNSFDFHLLNSNNSELYFTKTCYDDWGDIYYENDLFDIEYDFEIKNISKKEYINWYNEKFILEIDNEKFIYYTLSYLI